MSLNRKHQNHHDAIHEYNYGLKNKVADTLGGASQSLSQVIDEDSVSFLCEDYLAKLLQNTQGYIALEEYELLKELYGIILRILSKSIKNFDIYHCKLSDSKICELAAIYSIGLVKFLHFQIVDYHLSFLADNLCTVIENTLHHRIELSGCEFIPVQHADEGLFFSILLSTISTSIKHDESLGLINHPIDTKPLITYLKTLS